MDTIDWSSLQNLLSPSHPRLTRVLALLRAEVEMLELSKLWQFSPQLLSPQQVGVDGPVEVPLLEGEAGAEGLGVLEEEDGLGVEGLQGGEEDGAVLGEDLLAGGEGGGEPGHWHGALGGALVEVVRSVQPELGPLADQAAGQARQGEVGLSHSAEREVGGLLTIQNPTWNVTRLDTLRQTFL